MLSLTFVSDKVNTHVLPLLKAFLSHPEVVFTFISCADSAAEDEKKVVLTSEEKGHCLSYSQNPQKAQEIIDHSDVLILGMADPKLLQKAALSGKTLFHYSEHFSKNKSLMPLRYWHNHMLFHTLSDHGAYLLATSSFAPEDFAKAKLYQGRALYWGYFPEGNRSLDLSAKNVQKGAPLKILYSGRLLRWKHPEMALSAAETLFEAKTPFEVRIIGEGEMMEPLKAALKDKPYQNDVKLLGYQSNDVVLKEMKDSDIFLFTSDRGEGWGAVLNEAMSSSCAVLASSLAGATGFLVQDEKNGLAYNDHVSFEKQLLRLARDPDLLNRLAHEAKKTITDTWNAQVAVDHLLSIIPFIQTKKEIPASLIAKGPGTLIR